MKATNHNGDEFEVTEADMAQVAPLGHPQQHDFDSKFFVDRLKHLIEMVLPDGLLPTGFWDAYLDEGEWTCGVAGCKEAGTAFGCCIADHQVCIRPYDPACDDVFVRLPVALAACDSSFQVYTRSGDPQRRAEAASVTLDGEPYSPQDCIKDLAALLSVFRFFVARGDL